MIYGAGSLYVVPKIHSKTLIVLIVCKPHITRVPSVLPPLSTASSLFKLAEKISKLLIDHIPAKTIIKSVKRYLHFARFENMSLPT